MERHRDHAGHRGARARSPKRAGPHCAVRWGAILLVLAAFASAPVPRAAAQDEPDERDSDHRAAQRPTLEEVVEVEEEVETITIVYVPPIRHTTRTRIGSATRGSREDFPRLEALAPDHIGITSREQPELWWYLSDETDTRVDIVVIEDASIDPLLAITVAPQATGGMRALRLADHGVRLEAGKVYRWYVALVPDPLRRSRDVIASGAIQRDEVRGDLRRALQAAGESEVYAVFAQHGFWYDAVAEISERIAADPSDPGLRAARAGLLKQVGLNEVASRDRSYDPVDTTP